MSSITQKQINEFEKLKKSEMKRVQRTYIRQALDFTKYFNFIFPEVTTGYQRSDLISIFATMSNQAQDYSVTITEDINNSDSRIIGLTTDQTVDLASLKKIQFSLSTAFETSVQLKLQNVGNFQLSNAIWGADKQAKIYQQITEGIRQGKTKDELTKVLENYLVGSPNAGNLYNVNRVLDTEFQRAYFQTSIDSTRQFNQQDYGFKLLYKRSLSPAHKIYDICDSLVGVYDPDIAVPEIPSHPNCRCYMERIFSDEYKGSLKSLTVNENGVYVDKKFNQTNIML